MNFRETYKKDADMIKPDEAFIEKLSKLRSEQPRKRLTKTPFALAAAALVIVAVSVALSHNTKKFDSETGNATYGGAGHVNGVDGIAAEPQNDETNEPEADIGGDAVAPNETINGAINEERAGAGKPENAAAEAAGGGAADKSVPEYVVLQKNEAIEIRLYEDGTLEIIKDGKSWFFKGDESVFDAITEGGNG